MARSKDPGVKAAAARASPFLNPSVGTREWQDAWTRTIGYPVEWCYGKLQRLGHGVELHLGNTPRPVAFLEGFGWLHEPGTPARVVVLSDTAMKETLRAARMSQADVVAFVVEAVAAVLITQQLQGTVGPIFLRPNG